MITRAELRAAAGDERELALVGQLLGSMIEYPVDQQVAEEAGRPHAETASGCRTR